MKKILITGANSYIGTSFEKYVSQWPDKYIVDTVDMIDGTWKQKDFSKYDVVFHVAGIAHVSPNPKLKELYYKVNRDLAIDTAKKAKSAGVMQFIFMSSIIVYGESGADMSLEASFPEICPWQDEYDPDCPTELLVDGNEVDEYEFDHAVIQKWLPWVTIG
jgi:nucleoside-diphosphate-sugar epimerase